MIVRDMKQADSKTRADGVVMTDLFGEMVQPGAKVSMGHAVFPPGTVVPEAAHTGDEYSFILSGTIKCRIGDQVNEITEGMAGLIPAGELHSSFNDSDGDVSLIWMLVER